MIESLISLLKEECKSVIFKHNDTSHPIVVINSLPLSDFHPGRSESIFQTTRSDDLYAAEMKLPA